MDVISIGALLAMVAGLIGAYYTGALISSSPGAIAGQSVAVVLMVWARLTFKGRSFHASAEPTAGGLVTTGPYRFIRHPIYTAACLFCWSGILAHWSLAAAGFGVLVIAGGLVRMWREERLVTARYPEYRDYARVTRRMIPYIF